MVGDRRCVFYYMKVASSIQNSGSGLVIFNLL